jgi:hypothetical protein
MGRALIWNLYHILYTSDYLYFMSFGMMFSMFNYEAASENAYSKTSENFVYS